MARVHVHVHLPASKKPVQDESKPVESLKQVVKNEEANEVEVGAAVQELARRGVDPRTGKKVSAKEASRIAREMGDLASS